MRGFSSWLAGELPAELCRELGISRKAGYKIFDRYQECGIRRMFRLDRSIVCDAVKKAVR